MSRPRWRSRAPRSCSRPCRGRSTDGTSSRPPRPISRPACAWRTSVPSSTRPRSSTWTCRGRWWRREPSGARVTATDGYGNVQLNATERDLDDAGVQTGRVLVVNGRRLPRAGTFAELPEREPGLIVDSDGYHRDRGEPRERGADARPRSRRRRRDGGSLGELAARKLSGAGRAGEGTVILVRDLQLPETGERGAGTPTRSA